MMSTSMEGWAYTQTIVRKAVEQAATMQLVLCKLGLSGDTFESIAHGMEVVE